MTVKRMMSEMSSAEYAEWKAFSKVEPFGHDRDDLREGFIGYQLARCWTSEAKFENFIIDFEEKPLGEDRTEEQTVEEMQARLLCSMRLKNGDTSKSCS